MSILIRGISTPKNCRFCPCCTCCRSDYDRQHAEEYYICNLLPRGIIENADIRRKDCPLIEVPTPHGRLIDADKIEYHFEANENTAMECCEFVTKGEIGRVPTVVEKEE